MGETVRFGVSLDSDLLEKFDALCERQGCPSRSEALRDIIRDALVQDSLHSETADAAGVLSLIYDHHVRDLSRKLTERQHDAHGLIVTTLHVHLDHHNCLEILVLKGKAGELRELADQLRSIRGVTHGTFSITPKTSGWWGGCASGVPLDVGLSACGSATGGDAQIKKSLCTMPG